MIARLAIALVLAAGGTATVQLATGAEIAAGRDGVRPALRLLEPSRLVRPKGQCPGPEFEARLDDAQLEKLRDAGSFGYPITASGCSREYDLPAHHEVWEFDRTRAHLGWAWEDHGELSIEAVDQDHDGRIDQETYSQRDGGVIQSVEIVGYHVKGGHAVTRVRELARGGNKLWFERYLWRDGGWQLQESFDSTWRDEVHYNTIK